MDDLTAVMNEVLDEHRLAALRKTELLDSAPERAYDRLTELVSRVLDVPVALVSLVDSDRQFFKSSCGLPEPWASKRQTPLSYSFCKHVVATDAPLVVEDASVNPVVRENLAIRTLGVIAYLGIPLRTPDGKAIGSLCAIDSATRRWTADDIDVLSGIADSVMSEIALQMQMKEVQSYAQELRTSNEMLDHYTSELKEASAAKDRLFSIIAHDLRSPLQALVGYSEALVEQTGSQPESTANQFAVRLDRAVENMRRFLDNLLQWSRIQIGKMACHPRRFALADVLGDAIDIVRPQAEQKGVEIMTDYSPAVEVVADENLVTCVVHNLLTNAIKFTASGGTVRVAARQAGDDVDISVQDDGMGMSEETLAELFTRDQPVSRRGTDGEGGTGLGLILCRELVELNEGKISASSVLGQGTIMSFTLPVGPKSEELSAFTPAKDRAPSSDGHAVVMQLHNRAARDASN